MKGPGKEDTSDSGGCGASESRLTRGVACDSCGSLSGACPPASVYAGVDSRAKTLRCASYPLSERPLSVSFSLVRCFVDGADLLFPAGGRKLPASSWHSFLNLSSSILYSRSLYLESMFTLPWKCVANAPRSCSCTPACSDGFCRLSEQARSRPTLDPSCFPHREPGI